MLYVTDSKLKRIQAFELDGTFLGAWGTKGQGPYQLSSPSGITHDAAGNLYVADAENDRIVVFDPGTSPVTARRDTAVVGIGYPAQDRVMAAVSPAWIKGKITDDRRIATVEVAVQDRDSLQWWNAKLAKWQTGRVWNLAGVVSSGPRNGQWAFGLVGVERGERFTATVRATDAAGNPSTPIGAARRFTIAP